MSGDNGIAKMLRLKNPQQPTPPHISGSWLAGMVIGSAIMTMATQAMLLGAGAAIRDAAIKRD
jgi:hypothetical protein